MAKRAKNGAPICDCGTVVWCCSTSEEADGRVLYCPGCRKEPTFLGRTGHWVWADEPACECAMCAPQLTPKAMSNQMPYADGVDDMP
jgi:hypothetical protein